MLSSIVQGFAIYSLRMLAVGLVVVLTVAQAALLAEERSLSERLLTQYLEYQNVQVMGTVAVKEPEKELVVHEFVMRFGASVDGKLPPQDARILKPNPGEPHIKDELVTDIGYAYANNGISVQFDREYISKEPVSLRRSSLFLNIRPPTPIQPFYEINQAVLFSVEGVDPRMYWAMGSQAGNATDLEIVGSEEYLGFPCERVRYRILKAEGYPDWLPLSIEALVATGPTIQVLKVLSVSGGPPGYLDKEMIHTYLGIREVESVKRFGDWLICDRIVVTSGEYRTVVSVTDVQPLPKDYQGLWDYNALTGCLVGGTAEPSTRKDSARIPYEHSKEFMIAPYTDEELRLIHDFLPASEAAPPILKPGLSGGKIGFILINFFAVVLIVFYLRKKRNT